MAFEDFATYTETDPATYIAYSSAGNAQADFVGIPYNSTEIHFSKDFGSGHFGNFEHLVTCEYISAGEGSAYSKCFLTIGDTQEGWYGQTNALSVYLQGDSTPERRIYCIDKATQTPDFAAVSADTTYYLKITRSGTTYTVVIYDDAERTSEVDTIVDTCTNTTLQWCLVAQSFDGGAANGNRHISGYWKDLDLQEVVGAPGAMTLNTGYWGQVV